MAVEVTNGLAVKLRSLHNNQNKNNKDIAQKCKSSR